MNEFKNKFIRRDVPYKYGFFPQIPSSSKKDSVFILADGCEEDIIVKDTTTVRQIRKGKYSRLIEVVTMPYMQELNITSPSREATISFDVYVKVIIQVDKPLEFWKNSNIDIDQYIKNTLYRDVKRITGKYSVLDYGELDDKLAELSLCETKDETMGIGYRISAIIAQPGEQALEYVKRYEKQRLEADLNESARNQGSRYMLGMEEALRAEVASGNITEREALETFERYQHNRRAEKLDYYKELRKEGFITDKDVRDQSKSEMGNCKNVSIEEKEHKNMAIADTEAASFYKEEK